MTTYRALIGAMLLIPGSCVYPHDQNAVSESYQKPRVIVYSEWIKTQPLSDKAEPAADCGVLLTPQEIEDLWPSSNLNTSDKNRTKKSGTREFKRGHHKRQESIKSQSVQAAPQSVQAAPQSVQVVSHGQEKTTWLIATVAAIILLLQMAILFVMWRLKSGLRKSVSDASDLGSGSGHGSILLEKQLDNLRFMQKQNDEVVRAERAKNDDLRQEVDRLNMSIAIKPTAPISKNSLFDDIDVDRLLELQTDGFMQR